MFWVVKATFHRYQLIILKGIEVEICITFLEVLLITVNCEHFVLCSFFIIQLSDMKCIEMPYNVLCCI